MKLYRVQSDSVDYDEYDDVVVRAGSEEAARELVATGYRKLWRYGKTGAPLPGFEPHREITVTELSHDGPEEFLTTSFNAG